MREGRLYVRRMRRVIQHVFTTNRAAKEKFRVSGTLHTPEGR